MTKKYVSPGKSSKWMTSKPVRQSTNEEKLIAAAESYDSNTNIKKILREFDSNGLEAICIKQVKLGKADFITLVLLDAALSMPKFHTEYNNIVIKVAKVAVWHNRLEILTRLDFATLNAVLQSSVQGNLKSTDRQNIKENIRKAFLCKLDPEEYPVNGKESKVDASLLAQKISEISSDSPSYSEFKQKEQLASIKLANSLGYKSAALQAAFDWKHEQSLPTIKDILVGYPIKELERVCIEAVKDGKKDFIQKVFFNGFCFLPGFGTTQHRYLILNIAKAAQDYASKEILALFPFWVLNEVAKPKVAGNVSSSSKEIDEKTPISATTDTMHQVFLSKINSHKNPQDQKYSTQSDTNEILKICRGLKNETEKNGAISLAGKLGYKPPVLPSDLKATGNVTFVSDSKQTRPVPAARPSYFDGSILRAICAFFSGRPSSPRGLVTSNGSSIYNNNK